MSNLKYAAFVVSISTPVHRFRPFYQLVKLGNRAFDLVTQITGSPHPDPSGVSRYAKILYAFDESGIEPCEVKAVLREASADVTTPEHVYEVAVDFQTKTAEYHEYPNLAIEPEQFEYALQEIQAFIRADLRAGGGKDKEQVRAENTAWKEFYERLQARDLIPAESLTNIDFTRKHCPLRHHRVQERIVRCFPPHSSPYMLPELSHDGVLLLPGLRRVPSAGTMPLLQCLVLPLNVATRHVGPEAEETTSYVSRVLRAAVAEEGDDLWAGPHRREGVTLGRYCEDCDGKICEACWESRTLRCEGRAKMYGVQYNSTGKVLAVNQTVTLRWWPDVFERDGCIRIFQEQRKTTPVDKLKRLAPRNPHS
ncbi:hypothetical protein HYDPIDRAFT_166054 [Hydnomerulius pinastri MD-312]|nr:hypothetical protein HYDPIDRAFT_166054 [Hydnomerulius pinastri MD-312]